MQMEHAQSQLGSSESEQGNLAPAMPMDVREEFKKFLQTEFEKRCQRNSRYSLRAFAQFLDVEPSFLSKIFNGKRSITPNSIHRFGIKLGLDPKQISDLMSRVPRGKDKVVGPRPLYRNVEVDKFKLISDWYHFALLELTKTDDFQSNVKWIAEKLNISFGEALGAVERLKRLNLLHETTDGQWICQGHFSTGNDSFTASAYRNLQKQILNQAIDALEETVVEERNQSSITMVVDKDLVDEANKRIKKFRRDLCKFLESGKRKDRVYNLSISLFPVSHKN